MFIELMRDKFPIFIQKERVTFIDIFDAHIKENWVCVRVVCGDNDYRDFTGFKDIASAREFIAPLLKD